MFVARVQTAQTPALTDIRDSGSRGGGQAQRVIGRSVEHGTLLWLDRNIGQGNLWHGSELLLVLGHKRLREPQRENAGRVDQFRRTSRDLTHAECASGRLSRRSWIGARFRHHSRQFEDPTLLGDLCTFAERWNSKATHLTSSVTGFQETKSPNAGNVEMGNVKAENTCGEVLLNRIGKEEAEAVTAPRNELQSENAGAAALRLFRNQSTSAQKCRRWGLKQTTTTLGSVLLQQRSKQNSKEQQDGAPDNIGRANRLEALGRSLFFHGIGQYEMMILTSDEVSVIFFDGFTSSDALHGVQALFCDLS